MRWVGSTIVLVGAGWAASACGSSVFACSSDAQCQGAVAGTCQPEGYCSFPDESCPSGQRFGDAAPSGVANACVEPGEATGASTGPAQESSDGIESLPDPDGTPEGSTTTPVGDGTTTMSVGEATSTGPEPVPTTGMASEGMTTGMAEECSVTFVDPFDGTELSADWSWFTQPSTELWVDGGQLSISIGYSPDQWTVAGAIMEIDSLAGGWARLLVTEADESGLPIAGGVVLANEICQLQLYVNASGIGAGIWNDQTSMTTDLGFEPDPGVPCWLQLRQDEDGEVHFEWSPDAITWSEIAAGTFPECGDLLAGVVTGVNAGGQLQDENALGTRSFDQFELCSR